MSINALASYTSSMAIVDLINRDLTEAMKAREAERLSAIRMIKTALKLRETELTGGVDDAEAIKVLNTLLKQRRDAADQYRAGKREDLAQKEEREAVVIQSYLPASANEEEMSRAVEMKVPLKVDISYGANWSEAH